MDFQVCCSVPTILNELAMKSIPVGKAGKLQHNIGNTGRLCCGQIWMQANRSNLAQPRPKGCHAMHVTTARLVNVTRAARVCTVEQDVPQGGNPLRVTVKLAYQFRFHFAFC